MRFGYLVNGRPVSEESRFSPDVKCDVLVVGLGTAGAMAAICAAENGASVIGVEKCSAMGGLGTVGGVCDYFFGNSGGRFEDINRRAFELEVKYGLLTTDRHEDKSSVSSAAKAIALEEAALKAGCRIYYEAEAAGVFFDASRALGVRILTESGKLDIGAEYIIDATETDYICIAAGAEVMPGREFDDNFAMMATMNDVIDGRFSHWVGLLAGQTDMLKPEGVTPAYINAILKNPKQNFRSFALGALPAVRENRCIRTRRTVSPIDLIRRRKTEGALFASYSPLDNVNYTLAYENDFYLTYAMFYSKIGAAKLSVNAEMMLPEKIDGIIIAGRGIGVGHDLYPGYRMKKDMEKSGEAAGVLAALAVSANCAPEAVDISALRKCLSSSGCYRENSDYCEFTNRVKPFEPILRNETKLIEGLASDSCDGAMATLVYFYKPEEAERLLLPLLNSEAKTLADNAVFALGLIGSAAAVPYLREFVKAGVSPMDTAGHPKMLKAIYLLGKLGDEGSANMLSEIYLSRYRELAKIMPTQRILYYCSVERIEDQFRSFAQVALIKIIEKHPHLRETLACTVLRENIVRHNRFSIG